MVLRNTSLLAGMCMALALPAGIALAEDELSPVAPVAPAAAAVIQGRVVNLSTAGTRLSAEIEELVASGELSAAGAEALRGVLDSLKTELFGSTNVAYAYTDGFVPMEFAGEYLESLQGLSNGQVLGPLQLKELQGLYECSPLSAQQLAELEAKAGHWTTQAPEAQQLAKLEAHAAHMYMLAPDAKQLAELEAKAGHWNMLAADAQQLAKLEAHAAHMYMLSPDAKQLAELELHSAQSALTPEMRQKLELELQTVQAAELDAQARGQLSLDMQSIEQQLAQTEVSMHQHASEALAE